MRIALIFILFFFYSSSLFGEIAKDSNTSNTSLSFINWPLATIIITIILGVLALARDYVKSFKKEASSPTQTLIEETEKIDEIKTKLLLLENELKHILKDFQDIKDIDIKNLKEDIIFNRKSMENIIDTLNKQMNSIRELFYTYISREN